MELKLVTFEQAQSLKELGFPQSEKHKIYTVNDSLVDCVDFSYIVEGLKEGRTPDEIINAPSLELAAKWLREEKGIYVTPSLMYYNEPIDGWKHIQFEACVVDWNWKAYLRYKYYSTYEEALSAGIDKAIEILK